MACLLLILVFVVIGGAIWYGSRGPADGEDVGSWHKPQLASVSGANAPAEPDRGDGEERRDRQVESAAGRR